MVRTTTGIKIESDYTIDEFVQIHFVQGKRIDTYAIIE
jgi:hypothetical protein